MIWLTCRAQLLVPTGGGRNLSALCCRARRHSHAASHAHSPRPSSHVEAVGQHRGRTAAHTHCQAPRDVAAPLRLAPSRLQLPVRGPAPSNGEALNGRLNARRCRCMEFAVGAMPSLRRSEPAGAGPLLMLTSFVYASSISHFRWATIFLDLLAL